MHRLPFTSYYCPPPHIEAPGMVVLVGMDVDGAYHHNHTPGHKTASPSLALGMASRASGNSSSAFDKGDKVVDGVVYKACLAYSAYPVILGVSSTRNPDHVHHKGVAVTASGTSVGGNTVCENTATYTTIHAMIDATTIHEMMILAMMSHDVKTRGMVIHVSLRDVLDTADGAA